MSPPVRSLFFSRALYPSFSTTRRISAVNAAGEETRFRESEKRVNCGSKPTSDRNLSLSASLLQARRVRTGSWTGPPGGGRAPRVGISSTLFEVRA